MKWITLCVDTTDDGLEFVAAALDAAGIQTAELVESHARAMEVLSDSALYWDFADEDKVGADIPCVKAYLPDLPESRLTLEAARAAVERLKTLSLPVELGTLAVSVASGDDADWENNWKKFYTPIEIGQRLLILPEWEDTPLTGRAIVRLDPGVAFGTGTHHTTRMCLEFLERSVAAGMNVLDLGCGSGILSIAARLLGADCATAVDIDPLASKIAGENVAKNGICSGFRVLTGNVLDDAALQAAIGGPYDLAVANIVADVIIRLAPFVKACLKPGAPFITSGIIDERRDEVLSALQTAGFTAEAVSESGGWVAACMRA